MILNGLQQFDFTSLPQAGTQEWDDRIKYATNNWRERIDQLTILRRRTAPSGTRNV